MHDSGRGKPVPQLTGHSKRCAKPLRGDGDGLDNTDNRAFRAIIGAPPTSTDPDTTVGPAYLTYKNVCHDYKSINNSYLDPHIGRRWTIWDSAARGLPPPVYRNQGTANRLGTVASNTNTTILSFYRHRNHKFVAPPTTRPAHHLAARGKSLIGRVAGAAGADGRRGDTGDAQAPSRSRNKADGCAPPATRRAPGVCHGLLGRGTGAFHQNGVRLPPGFESYAGTESMSGKIMISRRVGGLKRGSSIRRRAGSRQHAPEWRRPGQSLRTTL